MVKNGSHQGVRGRGENPPKPPPVNASASLWDKLDEICDSKPRGKWRNLPSDLAKNLKHYLYGLPKR